MPAAIPTTHPADQIGCPFCPEVHTVTFEQFRRCQTQYVAKIVSSRIVGLDQAGIDPDEVQP